jgi:DNA-binding protein H-NS
LPRWVSFGCGAASLVVLLIVFLGGAWLSSGGFSQFLDFAFGMSLGEMRGMYAAEVTDAQKKALESEVETMRAAVRSRELAPANLQTVLQTMQKAMGDDKLTPQEVTTITEAVRKVNRGRRPKGAQAQRLNGRHPAGAPLSL